MKKKVIVAGGTGFIGKHLVDALLRNNYDVTILSRSLNDSNRDGLAYAVWDGHSLEEWQTLLEDSAAVINLCGASVAGNRWTPSYKQILRSSRLRPTEVLARAIELCNNAPGVFVNVSAIGYYGNGIGNTAKESDPMGEGFLATLCADWEKAALVAENKTRVVTPRIGLVLGEDGLLKKIKWPFKLGLGGVLGSGKQGFPWIHVDDVVDSILFGLESPGISGAFNVVAPVHDTNKSFTKTLGYVLRRPTPFPVPAAILKLLVGKEFAKSVLETPFIDSKLGKCGYDFKYKKLQIALEEVLISK